MHNYISAKLKKLHITHASKTQTSLSAKIKINSPGFLIVRESNGLGSKLLDLGTTKTPGTLILYVWLTCTSLLILMLYFVYI